MPRTTPTGGGVVARSGPIHSFEDDPGALDAYLASDADAPVPVIVRSFSSPGVLGRGTLVNRSVEDGQLVGTVEWPEDLDRRAAASAGGRPPAACDFADDGSLRRVVIEVDDPDPDACECGGTCGHCGTADHSDTADFRDWSTEERDKLDPADFAGPNKTFPIATQEDVEAAARLIGRAKNPGAIRKEMLAICKRKGLTPPESWEAAKMSASGPAGSAGAARFAAVIPVEGRRTEGGFNIYPNAILFEAGDYHDKNYRMSREELYLAADAFDAPVGGNIEHTDFMRGRACQVRSVRLDPADPDLLRGEVAVPVGFDAELTDAERRLSCEWDRQTKRLTGLALTINPRVKKAALVAAFSAGEACVDDLAALEREASADPDLLAEYRAEFARDRTMGGQSVLQSIHDRSAEAGAVCRDDPSFFSAVFSSAPEMASLQAAHDAACAGGAKCRLYSKDEMDRRGVMFAGVAAFTPKKRTDHAAKHHQLIHDVIATGFPAACAGGPMTTSAATPPATGPSAPPASFVDSPEQLKSLRKIHDMTTDHGATCPGAARMSGGGASQGTISMSKEALIKAVGALPDKAVDATDEQVKGLVKAIPAGLLARFASFASEAATPSDRFAKFADDPDFVAFKADQEKQLKAERDRIARLEADRAAELRARSIAQSVDFADRESDRLLLNDRANVLLRAAYFRADELDRAAESPLVKFAEGDAEKAVGLADALREVFALIPSSPMARQVVDANGQLPAEFTVARVGKAAAPSQAEVDAQDEKNLALTETGRQILANRKAASTASRS